MYAQATERFEAVYLILKEIALAGSPGSETMKQTTQQIFTFLIKDVREGMFMLRWTSSCML